MKRELRGCKKLKAGNEEDFIVYYYMQMDGEKHTYGVFVECQKVGTQKEIEYEEITGITDSQEVAEELVTYLMKYEATPISLPETIDEFISRKEQEE